MRAYVYSTICFWYCDHLLLSTVAEDERKVNNNNCTIYDGER